LDRLQILILSQDSNLVQAVRAALQDLGIVGYHFRSDSVRALELLERRHFDGIILDCDDLACAQEVLTKIRTGPSNRLSPVIAILNGMTELRAIQNCGANSNVCKPVSSGTIKAQLNQALDAMQRDHRRYLRYTVSLPLFVGAEKDDLTAARLINVSAEGLAVRLSRSLKLEGTASLRFDLPSIEPYRMEAKGEVAWADAEGHIGIKLSHMSEEARRRYGE